MRLLTICPSRNRPELLQRMLDSFLATKSEGTKIIVFVANDDPKLEGYRDLFWGELAYEKKYPDINFRIGNRLHLVEVINFFSSRVTNDFDYFQEINDDHVYMSQGWDAALINSIEQQGKGIGMAWGRDGMGNRDIPALPTAVVMSGNMLRALGYFFPPMLKHTYCDNALLDIGKATETIFYNPDVFIEHRHVIFGKAPMDDNYRMVMSKEALAEGRAAYEEWRTKDMLNDIERLNNAIKNRRAD